MEEKSRILELIKNADISNMFWADDIVNTIEDRYVRGYLKAMLGTLNESLCTNSEDYRIEFKCFCDYDIWDKK